MAQADPFANDAESPRLQLPVVHTFINWVDTFSKLHDPIASTKVCLPSSFSDKIPMICEIFDTSRLVGG